MQASRVGIQAQRPRGEENQENWAECEPKRGAQYNAPSHFFPAQKEQVVAAGIKTDQPARSGGDLLGPAILLLPAADQGEVEPLRECGIADHAEGPTGAPVLGVPLGGAAALQ